MGYHLIIKLQVVLFVWQFHFFHLPLHIFLCLFFGKFIKEMFLFVFFCLFVCFCFIIKFTPSILSHRKLVVGLKKEEELPFYLQTKKKILISVVSCFSLHLFLFILFVAEPSSSWEEYYSSFMISFGLIDISFIGIIVFFIQLTLVSIKGLNESISIEKESHRKVVNSSTINNNSTSSGESSCNNSISSGGDRGINGGPC